MVRPIQQLSKPGSRTWAWLFGMTILLGLHTGGIWLRLGWALALLPGMALATAAAWRMQAREPGDEQPTRMPRGTGLLLAFLALYLISSASGNHWFYFANWAPAGLTRATLHSRLVWWSVGTGMLAWLLAWRRPSARVLLLGAVLASQALCLYYFYRLSGGEILFRSDHSSFTYRFWAFGEVFPNLVYYDPTWNAGKNSSYLIASGSPALGIPFLPFWKFTSPLETYTHVIAAAYILVLPLFAGWSARWVGGSSRAMGTAALLALGTSHFNFMWSLHFGTVPASFASACALPLMALIYRVLFLDRRTAWTALGLVFFGFEFLCWPVSWILAPLLLLAMMLQREFWQRANLLFLLACGAGIGLLCLPFLLGVLGHSDPKGFADMLTQKVEWGPAFLAGLRKLARLGLEMHPWLLFAGIGGLFLGPDRRLRRLCGPAMLGLALVAGWGQLWKPQFQLGRAAMPLMWIGILPAALWAERWLSSRAPRHLVAQAALLALLVLGGFNVARWYDNRGPAPLGFLGPETRDFIAWIQAHVPPDARLLFAGPTVHGFAGGQVAALAPLSGREMMACDYFNFSPQRVEYEYPPRPFRKPEDRVRDFMDLFNVSHVVTYHTHWQRYFEQRTNDYALVHSFGGPRIKKVYAVNRTGTLFHQGSGRIEARPNRLRVQVDDPATEAVLRYQWAPGLVADAPAELFPVDLGRDIILIGLRPNGRRETVIRHARWF